MPTLVGTSAVKHGSTPQKAACRPSPPALACDGLPFGIPPVTLPASRRRFLQLAGAGLAVAGTGLPQLGHAQPATAAAPAPAEGAVLLNF
ncbi:TPA: twin-arginine translocation signal domain-containing protein, partial [Stenotrophomonas maltophilia]